MELTKGKQVVAKFLTGGLVRLEELQKAIEAVQSDPEYVLYLRSQMGAHGWVSPCEIFLSSLDEFAEMSPEQRERDMPRSTEHLRTCPACQRAYWEVMPLWIAEPDASRSTSPQEPVKLLATAVSVVRGPRGQIVYRLGPPPQEQQVRGAAARWVGVGPPDADIGRRREWVLPDEESGILIALRLEALEDGDFSLAWTLNVEDGEAIDPKLMRIEVKDRVQGSIFGSGWLSDFQSRIVLPAGSWTVRLSLTTAGAGRSWEIPLDLEREDDG